MLEINDIITEWEANIEQQYAPDARVPCVRNVFVPPPFVPEVEYFGTYPDWLLREKHIHPFAPSRPKSPGEHGKTYGKFVAAERVIYDGAMNPDFPREYIDAKTLADGALVARNQGALVVHNATLPPLRQAHADAEDAFVVADDLNPIFSGVQFKRWT